MDTYVIIVAGGKGMRMKSDVPKQFLEIGGMPVLLHTLHTFYAFNPRFHFIVVLPRTATGMWREIMKRQPQGIPHRVVAGGSTRAQSTLNGLALVPPESMVAVHDGVRPLVSHATLQRCLDTAMEKGNAIPVWEVYESLRAVEGSTSKAIDRNRIRVVQTPQVFHASLLKRAFEQHGTEDFTDEASMVEKLGIKINLVEGNRENIKITDAFDLKLAEYLIQERSRVRMI